MTENALKIFHDARKLGIEEQDAVLVHSSLKSLGVDGITPRDVIDGLREAVKGGTLIFPTLSYQYCNPSQREFDYYKTPSNVGAIPEYFRTQYEGAVRSLCPTHSCAAVGHDAEFLTTGQENDKTPCGANSPFRKLRDIGGKILFLGCGCNCNTSMHAVEELVEPDYLYGDSYTYTLTDKNGQKIHMDCRAHGFKGVRQCYYRIFDLLDSNAYADGKILGADCRLVKTVPMWETAEKTYRLNQHYFIDRV